MNSKLTTGYTEDTEFSNGIGCLYSEWDDMRRYD